MLIVDLSSPLAVVGVGVVVGVRRNAEKKSLG
jgi:hypothetical protein